MMAQNTLLSYYSLTRTPSFPIAMSPDVRDAEQNNRRNETNSPRTFFYERPFFLSLTIGIPFCIFKLLFGMTAIHLGSPEDLPLVLFGGLVIVWAAADLLMNTGRTVLDLIGLPAPFEFCTLAQLGHLFHKPMVFLAIDTLLTFTIICAMLWSGWITHLTGIALYLWCFATTANLISLSLVVVYTEIRKARD
jgi:hypothetical protein